MKTIGFDNDKYLAEQASGILERQKKFGDKLYLEFGGKLMWDMHAARVLPGYDPNVKIKLLQKLKDHVDIVLCIFAGDIERKKMRADFGISYDADAMKLIDDLRKNDLTVRAVVITRFDGQPAAIQFRDKLTHRGIKVYCHRSTRGYPTDIDTIVSDEGYGAAEYVQTERPIVVVTGPGPGSGKLATCLSMLYHDSKAGRKAGYAKFETFPIWNLPLKHPVNIAYEAATADLQDVNMIDPFHMEAYGEIATNYNRDVAAFPLLRAIWERITQGSCPYKSPTDMGVNCCASGIVDDNAVRDAACQEIIRRYFRAATEYALGSSNQEAVNRIEMLMKELSLKQEDRNVVIPARMSATECRQKGKGFDGIYTGAAIELPNGTIVTGKNSQTMNAASAAVLNAVKHLAGIPDKLHLLPPEVITAILTLKREILGEANTGLNLDELLIALAISAPSNPVANAAMESLKELKDCEMHLTHIVAPGDESGLRRIGLRPTSDPQFRSAALFN